MPLRGTDGFGRADSAMAGMTSAGLVQQRLNAEAAGEVARLLALEDTERLADISTWADEHRSPATARWHFVNLGRDCRYRPDEHCPDGQCVVEAIRRQSKVLESSASDVDRLKALKYLAHLVADVHQPLHAGFAEDRGGNSFQLQWAGRGSNLHRVWDSGLIEVRPGGVDVLAADVEAAAGHVPLPSSPATWAEESCRVVAPWYYPDTRKPGQMYAEQADATVLARLNLAAWRLVQVIEGTLLGR